jgi:hypothetical protein
MLPSSSIFLSSYKYIFNLFKSFYPFTPIHLTRQPSKIPSASQPHNQKDHPHNQRLHTRSLISLASHLANPIPIRGFSKGFLLKLSTNAPNN